MTTISEHAQRGHRAIELHTDLHPQGIDLETAASDIIADILHALADAGLLFDDLDDGDARPTAQETLDRALRTYQGDYADRDPEHEALVEGLSWASTGNLNSRDHIAKIEPFQNLALCGAGISGMTEIRPANPNVCPKCRRAARALGVEADEVGIPNTLEARLM